MNQSQRAQPAIARGRVLITASPVATAFAIFAYRQRNTAQAAASRPASDPRTVVDQVAALDGGAGAATTWPPRSTPFG